MFAHTLNVCMCLMSSMASAAAGPAVTDEIHVDQAVVLLIDNIQIPAEEHGTVQSIPVREGDAVARGDVVVQLRSDMHQLQLEIAHSRQRVAELTSQNDVDMRFAEKSQEVAEKILDRSLAANRLAPRAITKTEIERLQLELQRSLLSREQAQRDQDKASAELDNRTAELSVARLRLQNRAIQSPIDGVVVERLVQPGEWVDAGQPVIRVIRLDRLRVRCLLDADQFDRALTGAPVALTVNLPPDQRLAVFKGTVTFVSPEVIPNRNEIYLWAEVDNPDYLLRPGCTGKLTIGVSR